MALPKFVAHNFKRIPPIEPGTADLCFLLESIEDVRKKIDSLINIRRDVTDLQTAVKSLSQPQPTSYSSVLRGPQQKSTAPHQFHNNNFSHLAVGSNSQHLRVKLPLQLNFIFGSD